MNYKEPKSIFKSFMQFDKMVTPVFIKIIFYIGLVVSLIISFALIGSGLNAYYGGGLLVFLGIISLVILPILVRVHCELLIVFFKIHETLVDIKEDGSSKMME